MAHDANINLFLPGQMTDFLANVIFKYIILKNFEFLLKVTETCP